MFYANVLNQMFYLCICKYVNKHLQYVVKVEFQTIFHLSEYVGNNVYS